jgi:hypothetical protein
MKKIRRAIAVVGIAVIASVGLAAPAQAHYDPWTTHWHYTNGIPTYKQCSWWDSLWGCKNEYLPWPYPIYV